MCLLMGGCENDAGWDRQKLRTLIGQVSEGSPFCALFVMFIYDLPGSGQESGFCTCAVEFCRDVTFIF